MSAKGLKKVHSFRNDHRQHRRDAFCPDVRSHLLRQGHIGGDKRSVKRTLLERFSLSP